MNQLIDEIRINAIYGLMVATILVLLCVLAVHQLLVPPAFGLLDFARSFAWYFPLVAFAYLTFFFLRRTNSLRRVLEVKRKSLTTKSKRRGL